MTFLGVQVQSWLGPLGTALAGLASLYSVVAWLCVLRTPIEPSPKGTGDAPPVTLLKPLCGEEPETYDLLRSFCVQNYPSFQIVFGVADIRDPVVKIVERLQREFPLVDMHLVADAREHGTSRKVSNLINMIGSAKHHYLVLSDGDVRVTPDYVSQVVVPLLDETVGIVTCVYRGEARRSLWSLLGSLFINEWFIPSVRVAARAGSQSFAFGATIGIRRDVLSRVGGFAAIADELADDYRLGELTRNDGLRTVLSEVVVETLVADASLVELIRHEIRWLRTIRAVQPAGYFCLGITFGTPVAAIGSWMAGGSAITLCLLALTAVMRVTLHVRHQLGRDKLAQLVLLPVRDALSLGLWAFGFATRRVRWRDALYQVSRDGSVRFLAEG